MSVPVRSTPAAFGALGAALALTLVMAVAVIAQVNVSGGGHALDGSLQLGSGGYNGRAYASGAMNPRIYAPGVYNTAAYRSPGTIATLQSNTWQNYATYYNARSGALDTARPYRPGGYSAGFDSAAAGAVRVDARAGSGGAPALGTYSYPVPTTYSTSDRYIPR